MLSKKQQGIDLLTEVWQNGNYDFLPQICHGDVRRHHERMPARGLDEYRRVVEFYRNTFSELRYDISSIIEESDQVAVMYTVTGTHTGPYGQIPATGKRDTVSCMDFYRFRDERMTDIFTSIDELGLLMKLGVLGTA